jgi:hypothetical protein
MKRDEGPIAFEKLVDRFEDEVAALDRAKKLEFQVVVASQAMVTLTFMLNALVRDVYKDLLDRSGLDHRWEHQRHRFLSSHGVLSGAACWPS